MLRARKRWVIRHLRFFCFSAAAGTFLRQPFRAFKPNIQYLISSFRHMISSAAASKAAEDRLCRLRICFNDWAFAFLPKSRMQRARSKLARSHFTSLILHRWAASTRRHGCRSAAASQAMARARRKTVRHPPLSRTCGTRVDMLFLRCSCSRSCVAGTHWQL